jgi:hypothetical protein
VPEATDPANARLALRRLARSLLGRDAGDPPHDGDVAAWLDSDELADYEQIVAALAEVEPPRFAVLNWNGWALLDVGGCQDPHASGEALVVIAGEEKVVRALAALLNLDPGAFDRIFDSLPEPF